MVVDQDDVIRSAIGMPARLHELFRNCNRPDDAIEQFMNDKNLLIDGGLDCSMPVEVTPTREGIQQMVRKGERRSSRAG